MLPKLTWENLLHLLLAVTPVGSLRCDALEHCWPPTQPPYARTARPILALETHAHFLQSIHMHGVRGRLEVQQDGFQKIPRARRRPSDRARGRVGVVGGASEQVLRGDAGQGHTGKRSPGLKHRWINSSHSATLLSLFSSSSAEPNL